MNLGCYDLNRPHRHLFNPLFVCLFSNFPIYSLKSAYFFVDIDSLNSLCRGLLGTIKSVLDIDVSSERRKAEKRKKTMTHLFMNCSNHETSATVSKSFFPETTSFILSVVLNFQGKHHLCLFEVHWH